MQLDRPFIRLPYRFDADRLIEEVSSISDDAWQAHPTGHVGNTALSLVARGGDRADDSIGGVHAPTANLVLDSYLAQVIEAFEVRVGRTRLMRIDPGAEATPHFDAHLYWFDRVRIHVPIITTPEVTFLCGDDRVHMAAGDSWVFDTFRRHNVLNPAPSHRVHLVIDTVGSTTMWEAVRSADGASPVEVAFEPGRRAEFDCEQESIAPVMPAEQMASLAERFVALLPDGDAGERFAEAVNRHAASWSEAWAACGSDPHAPVYRSILDRFADRLAELDDVTIEYNRASAQFVAAALLVNSALGPTPPGTPMRPSRSRKSQEPDATPESTPAEASPSVTNVPNDDRFDRPVFLVGPPRSGGSVVFDVLARTPDVMTAGGPIDDLVVDALGTSASGRDSDRLTADDATDEVCERLRDAIFERLTDRRGVAPADNTRFVRLVDHTPANSLRIEFLRAVFPDAHFVYVVRPARETISSMLEAWRSGAFARPAQPVGWAGPDGLAWSLPLVPGWSELADASLAEICAFQWEYIASTALDDVDRVAHGRWTSVSFERFLESTQSEAKSLCQFADVRRIGEPIGTLPASRGTLTDFDPEKWRANGVELAEVLPGLDATAQRVRAVGEVTTGAIRVRRDAARSAAAAPRRRQSERLASKHTDTVVELLQKANASVFMSTYQSGRVATMRVVDDALHTQFTKIPRPMGMALGRDGHLAIGTNDEVWTYRDQPAAAQKLEPVGSYGACFVLRQRHHTGDIAIHEMAYGSDGRLWIVNTRFSCLASIEADTSFTPMWMPSFVTDLTPEDRCHLNGLAMRAGRPSHVSVFAESNEAGGWRNTKATTGAIIDLATDEFAATGLCMPHSPRWHRDQLWVLESGKGSLSRVDLDSGTAEVVATLPGFTRGLSFIGRYALVGLSQVRESVFDGLPLTQSDAPRHSGLWVVDIETGSIVGFVRFDGSVQEVFDVQVRRGHGHAQILDLDADAHSQSFVVPSSAIARARDRPSQLA